jgi:hypothetical protein
MKRADAEQFFAEAGRKPTDRGAATDPVANRAIPPQHPAQF